MSKEETEKRCKYDSLDFGVCLEENDPSTENCADCMIQQLAISIEDDQNVVSMRLLHILKDILKDLKKEK